MLYAILCYNDENAVASWSKEQEDAVMVKLAAVQERLATEKKLGPVARLQRTTSATTLRKTRESPLVIDGPFAETKEHLLGFFVVECRDAEEAVAVARELAAANPDGGAYEIRPIATFFPARAGWVGAGGAG